jgi:hypothetical protein
MIEYMGAKFDNYDDFIEFYKEINPTIVPTIIINYPSRPISPYDLEQGTWVSCGDDMECYRMSWEDYANGAEPLL